MRHRKKILVSTADLGVSVSVAEGAAEGEGGAVGVGDDGGGVSSVSVGDGGGVRGGGVVSNGGGVDNRSGVDGVSGLGHDGVESIVVIGGVVDGAGGSVGLHQAVVSLDHIAVAGLGLALLVAGVRVSHSVLVRVVGDGLRI
jgi:hypothetical protein